MYVPKRDIEWKQMGIADSKFARQCLDLYRCNFTAFVVSVSPKGLEFSWKAEEGGSIETYDYDRSSERGRHIGFCVESR